MKQEIILKGIDVAQHQGIIDWPKVKASGIDFAMIRVGYGRGNSEKQAERNLREALKVGLKVGAYWFCYALDPEEAILEAEECLKIIEPYRGQLTFPIGYDLEASGSTKPGEMGSEEYAAYMGRPYTPEMRTAIVHAFLGRIEEAGYYATLYTNWDYLVNRYIPNSMEKFDIWLSSPGVYPYRTCGIWQYDWHGRVNGIAGDVDLDYAHLNYPEIIKNNGLNGFAKSKSEEKDEPVEIKKEYLVEIPFETAEDRERFLQSIRRARKTDRKLTPENLRADK